MGLLSYQNTIPDSNHLCISYSEQQVEEFDSFFRAARACSLLANMFLGVSVLFLMCMSCIAVRYSVVTILSGAVLLGGLLQGMTLLVYFSSFSCDACRVHFGSGLALLGAIASMACGGVVCHIPEAPYDYYDEDGDDDLSDEKHIDRPSTPRFATHRSGRSGSTSSEGDEDGGIVIPRTWTVEDAEVVIVLPDGSKQTIEPISTVRPTCGAMCSFLP